jgi:hypothetical protein
MTPHLKPQELSAHQDGMLAGAQRARAEAHLATCGKCRAALERTAKLEKSLEQQLAKDPGDSYFRDFAARVEARIRPGGAPKLGAKAPPGGGFWGWLNTPVGMSWAGAVAVLVVGAGVALITVRAISPTAFRAPPGATRTDQVSSAAPSAEAPSPAPSAGAAAPSAAQGEPKAQPGADQPPASPSADAEGAAGAIAQDRPADQRAESAPARAVEVRPGPNGENVIVEHRKSPVPAPAPPAPANLQGVGPVTVRKSLTAQPLTSSSVKQPTPSKTEARARTPAPRTAAGGSAPTSASREASANPSAARSGNAAAGANQRCGAVRDAGGHPVAGAQLMLVETGSSAQSRSDGSFCLDVSSAARTLVVMAVGFDAQRLTLDPGDQGPLTLTLHAVSVTGGVAGGVGSGPTLSPGASRWVQKPGAASGSPPSTLLDANRQAPTPIGSTETFTTLSDSVRVLTVKALQFENDAARSQSAEKYKLAGEEWQKVLKRTQDTSAEGETRFRIAAAYYRAWQLEPTHSRSVIALEAISSFVLRAPSGPERDQAVTWLGQLRWGDTKATDR